MSAIFTRPKVNSVDSFNEKMAETSTRYPQDSLVSLRCNLTKALDAVAAILILAHFAPWQTDTMIRTISQQAYIHKYEGDWDNVQKLLENDDQSFLALQKQCIGIYGSRPYYGNLLPRALLLLKRIKFVDLTQQSHRPVHRGERIRGYRDKGSRRLSHEYHGDPPEAEEREDRRPNVKHPLLFNGDKIKTKNQNGDVPDSTAPRKEELQ